jgi:hypothetical protein
LFSPEDREPSVAREAGERRFSAGFGAARVAIQPADRGRGCLRFFRCISCRRALHESLKELLSLVPEVDKLQLGRRSGAGQFKFRWRYFLADQLERKVIPAGCDARRDSPWRNAFWLERALPSAVVGPVLLVALRRLAALCFSEVMAVARSTAAAKSRCPTPFQEHEFCHRVWAGFLIAVRAFHGAVPVRESLPHAGSRV